MSLRTRLLLIFGAIVGVTVALVSYAVSVRTRKMFQRQDVQRIEAIKNQIDRELQLEGESARSGDVEVDVQSNGWHAHGHDRNDAFKNVALHVVWEGEARNGLPTLSLKSVLDSPLNELVTWLGSEAAQKFPEGLLGQCAAPLRGLLPEFRVFVLGFEDAHAAHGGEGALYVRLRRGQRWGRGSW